METYGSRDQVLLEVTFSLFVILLNWIQYSRAYFLSILGSCRSDPQRYLFSKNVPA